MARMTFVQAVDFIMARLNVAARDSRSTRDKVRKRVSYGLRNGSLPRLNLTSLDVDRDELIYWARKKWPGKFNIPINQRATVSESVEFGGSADGISFPSTVEASRAFILELFSNNQELEKLIKQHMSTIAKLKPLAEQYERNRAKNRKSARKPRH